jgi:uncharacterized membrane-anchored protein YhcB (DUF1043 family)
MILIDINNPKQVNSKKVYNQVLKFAKDNVRSKDINIIMHFVCNDELFDEIVNDFRKVKNKVYFLLDERKYND